MTPNQIELARHALGLPNKKNRSYRNHFCTGPGSTDFDAWESMVESGDALRRTGPQWGGDNMYYLTLKAALSVRLPKENLSMEDVQTMLEMEESHATAGS